MTEPTITTAIAIGCDSPILVVAALREFAGRIERGEIGPKQEGEQTERCADCGEGVRIVWSIDLDEDEDEDEDEGVGGMKALFGEPNPDGTYNTPFGRVRVN